MALMNCDECDGKVSDKASACPHCGAPVATFTCEECDGRVSEKVRACPHCGAPVHQGLSSKKTVPVATEPQTTKSDYNVVIVWIGTRKIGVIKAVRDATGLGLKEAKDLVESTPVRVKTGLSHDAANALRTQLQETGAVVQLTRGDVSPPQALDDYTTADLLVIAEQAGFEVNELFTKSEIISVVRKPKTTTSLPKKIAHTLWMGGSLYLIISGLFQMWGATKVTSAIKAKECTAGTWVYDNPSDRNMRVKFKGNGSYELSMFTKGNFKKHHDGEWKVSKGFYDTEEAYFGPKMTFDPTKHTMDYTTGLGIGMLCLPIMGVGGCNGALHSCDSMQITIHSKAGPLVFEKSGP